MRNHEQAYAIVRLDAPWGSDGQTQARITVKRIVWTRKEAEDDVARLNALNAEKGCEYFWQATRVAPRPVDG